MDHEINKIARLITEDPDIMNEVRRSSGRHHDGGPPDSWYNPTDRDLGITPSWTSILGEGDEDSEYVVEVWWNGEDWEVQGHLDVREYELQGTEPPEGRPVRKVYDGIPYMSFENPGKRLENIPEPLKTAAKKWIDGECESIIEIKEHRGYDDGYPDERPDNYYDDRY